MRLPRLQCGLFPQDALTVDLRILTLAVVNVPVTKEKLSRLLALVLHFDQIREDKLSILRLRIRKGEGRTNRHANPLGSFLVVHEAILLGPAWPRESPNPELSKPHISLPTVGERSHVYA